MKKETKRYSLVEYVGKTIRYIKTEKEYDELVKFIKKCNSKKTSKYYFGNVRKKKSKDGFEVEVHLYSRLTIPRTISDIDDECRKFKSLDEMITYNYKDNVKHVNPDIYISYFETRDSKDKNEENYDVGIRPLALFFECDQKYFDEAYIKKCIAYHATKRDYSFFMQMCDEFCLTKDITEQIIKLRAAINSCRYENGDTMNMSICAVNLMHNLIYERDKNRRVLRDENGKIEVSHRRTRDFGSFVRDYQMVSRKKISTTHYNVPQDTRDLGAKPKDGTEIKFLR